MYYVYKVRIGSKIRYVGYTNNITAREKQHNYLCFKQEKKKILYNNIRKYYPDVKEISLITVKTFSNKVDAKRYECYLILNDYFTNKEFWQRVPRISDV